MKQEGEDETKKNKKKKKETEEKEEKEEEREERGREREGKKEGKTERRKEGKKERASTPRLMYRVLATPWAKGQCCDDSNTAHTLVRGGAALRDQ